jgi:hypothetical protein
MARYEIRCQARPEGKPYPSDASEDEWSLAVSYLTLMPEDAEQREHPLRELFNGLRYGIRYGIASMKSCKSIGAPGLRGDC